MTNLIGWCVLLKPHLKLAAVVGLSPAKLLISTEHTAKGQQLGCGRCHLCFQIFIYVFPGKEKTAILALVCFCFFQFIKEAL